MAVAVVTGSAGLIGSEATAHFIGLGMTVVGVDNDMRSAFFGPEASTRPNVERLQARFGSDYVHADLDVRDRDGVLRLFERYRGGISVVVHTAAQPSHDWAAKQPFVDFDINAVGTLNCLEAARLTCPEAPFIFTSTNKVYGDTPNRLPLVELETRFEIEESHTYADGIREDMPIDACLHSLFGASKVAADVLVQEYGRYFGMPTACFRGGTLTGPQHAATQLHGFLAYVMRCTMAGVPYEVFGYKGKQVRDAIHSRDLIRAFHAFFERPRVAEVYNIGGGRTSNASVLEAIRQSEEIAGRPLTWSYNESNRTGDHVWWIGDNSRFQSHYPGWRLEYDVPRILQEIYEENAERWTA
ncbi:MAG TPA: NAD-dependent epimerase/dehydratase family protein [Actinomycetota bacterium]|nr:NAD-dependent epimerase/dehydratase family protein [Actinomycetota bacterium]